MHHKCYLDRLHVTRGSLLVIISLKMSLLNHHVPPMRLINHLALCMLSEEIVKLKLPHVLKCAKIQSCELKIAKQMSIPLGSALGPYMYTIIVPLLVMVSLQDWD